jgi:hypothetical protein
LTGYAGSGYSKMAVSSISPEIEAYHLHRYQDIPDREGGLRLGIVTETGVRKLGWDAYREIGTGSAQEREFESLADQIIHR